MFRRHSTQRVSFNAFKLLVITRLDFNDLLEAELQKERNKSSSFQTDVNSSESTSDWKLEVERLRQTNKALNTENNRLEMELTAANKKYNELKAKVEEDQSGYGDIQSQSVEQIRTLGEENKRLKEETISLRSELTMLKSANQRASSDQPEITQLKQEVEQLRQELNNYKSAEKTPLKGFLSPLDIDSMSEIELRIQLRSEHNQLETTTAYIRDIEELIDQQLKTALPQNQLPSTTAPTHEKLTLLVDALRSSNANEDLILELRQTADNNFQCAEEWQAEAQRLQDELYQNEDSMSYLRQCVECAQQYLHRLVGSDFSSQVDSRGYLESQFELVCRRSEKLLAEYKSVKRELEMYRDSSAQFNPSSLARIQQLIQRIAERLNFARGERNPSWSVLEHYLQEIFTFADEVVPKTRETIVKKDNEIKRLRRELRRVRPFEASGRLCHVC